MQVRELTKFIFHVPSMVGLLWNVNLCTVVHTYVRSTCSDLALKKAVSVHVTYYYMYLKVDSIVGVSHRTDIQYQ